MDHLPWILLGIRATHIEDVSTSPAEMVFGVPLTVPGKFRDLSRAPPATEPVLWDLQQAVARPDACSSILTQAQQTRIHPR